MTENQKEVLKYKDYPEGSGGKAIYDRYFLTFDRYLEKYYSNSNNEEWTTWLTKYLEPAFNESRHDEMVKNFGYAKKEYHDFKAQQMTYSQLSCDLRLTEDVRKFIGFLAGANGGFFKKYGITVEQWFDMKNWHNPNIEDGEGHTINEILGYPYGSNYLKMLLMEMPYWRR